MHQSPLSLAFLFAETRRSSENDSQSCEVPGFLKLAWSFKQLPKVRCSAYWEMPTNMTDLIHFVNLWFSVSAVIAPPSNVWDGLSSGPTPAAVCKVMWWVWIIRLVTEQIYLLPLCNMSLHDDSFANQCFQRSSYLKTQLTSVVP